MSEDTETAKTLKKPKTVVQKRIILISVAALVLIAAVIVLVVVIPKLASSTEVKPDKITTGNIMTAAIFI